MRARRRGGSGGGAHPCCPRLLLPLSLLLKVNVDDAEGVAAILQQQQPLRQVGGASLPASIMRAS